MSFLTLFRPDTPSYWSLFIIMMQGFVVLCGVALIIVTTAVRRWQKKRYDAIAPLIQEQVSNIACGLPADRYFLLHLKGDRRRKAREYILSAIGGISGDARKYLSDLYHELGFSREDYKLLSDSEFPVRLAAISRLEAVMDREANQLIFPLLRDASPYVHFSALRFMLKQKSKHKPRIEAEMELAVIINRFDIAREILDCYVKVYPSDFVDLLRTVRNPKIRDVCLDVILKNKLIETIPVLQDHVIEALRSEGHEEYGTFDFKKYILCLTLSPMPDCEELLVKMTEVEDAMVRFSAYRAFFKIRPDLKFEYVEKLIQDDSPHIVRLGMQIREEKQKLEAA